MSKQFADNEYGAATSLQYDQILSGLSRMWLYEYFTDQATLRSSAHYSNEARIPRNDPKKGNGANFTRLKHPVISLIGPTGRSTFVKADVRGKVTRKAE